MITAIFPDPDLVPLVVEESRIREIQKTLPELPEARRARFSAMEGVSAVCGGGAHRFPRDRRLL
jgi:aspartyl-tRNA(Asn)/glutamyl-tRNA(Gln) amidotransferase subunit B